MVADAQGENGGDTVTLTELFSNTTYTRSASTMRSSGNTPLWPRGCPLLLSSMLTVPRLDSLCFATRPDCGRECVGCSDLHLLGKTTVFKTTFSRAYMRTTKLHDHAEVLKKQSNLRHFASLPRHDASAPCLTTISVCSSPGAMSTTL